MCISYLLLCLNVGPKPSNQTLLPEFQRTTLQVTKAHVVSLNCRFSPIEHQVFLVSILPAKTWQETKNTKGLSLNLSSPAAHRSS